MTTSDSPVSSGQKMCAWGCSSGSELKEKSTGAVGQVGPALGIGDPELVDVRVLGDQPQALVDGLGGVAGALGRGHELGGDARLDLHLLAERDLDLGRHVLKDRDRTENRLGEKEAGLLRLAAERIPGRPREDAGRAHDPEREQDQQRKEYAEAKAHRRSRWSGGRAAQPYPLPPSAYTLPEIPVGMKTL